MDTSNSGYLSPRTTQDTDRSISLAEVLLGIREALHTLGKKNIVITGISPFALHPHSMGNRATMSPWDTKVSGLLQLQTTP